MDKEKCPDCEGKGGWVKMYDGTWYQECPTCRGTGLVSSEQAILSKSVIRRLSVQNPKLLEISSNNYGEDGIGLSQDQITSLLMNDSNESEQEINSQEKRIRELESKLKHIREKCLYFYTEMNSWGRDYEDIMNTLPFEINALEEQIQEMRCCGNCLYKYKTEDEHIEHCIPCDNKSNWKMGHNN